jgi:hypothetical protein
MVTDKGIEGMSGFRVVGKNGYTGGREDVTLMNHKVQLCGGCQGVAPLSCATGVH